MLDTPLPPYYVVEILDPTDWWENLGLKRFDIDKVTYPAVGVAHEDDLADLDNLYRRIRPSEGKNSWHHWIYASQWMFHAEGSFIDDWNQALNELLQYRHTDPAKFHFISCSARFLCNARVVNGPALLHFTTEVIDPETDSEGFGRRKYVPGYEKVIARVIKLPV